MDTWKMYNIEEWFHPPNMKTGRYKKKHVYLIFGPLKHIQKSKQSEADTWEPLLVSFI